MHRFSTDRYRGASVAMRTIRKSNCEYLTQFFEGFSEIFEMNLSQNSDTIHDVTFCEFHQGFFSRSKSLGEIYTPEHLES